MDTAQESGRLVGQVEQVAQVAVTVERGFKGAAASYHHLHGRTSHAIVTAQTAPSTLHQREEVAEKRPLATMQRCSCCCVLESEFNHD